MQVNQRGEKCDWLNSWLFIAPWSGSLSQITFPMMVNAAALEEENHLDNETIKRLLSDLKQLFPGGSEQLILEVIYENHGNYERIIHELTQHVGSPRHAQPVNPVMPYGPNLMYPPYKRSVSDITGFSGNGKPQPVRPFNLEMSGPNIIQHIRRQQESCKRLEEKVHSLRKETKRLQLEIHREEEELNTRSKVQKNPTEKDIEKHREEIAILRKEVQEANNILERARGGINSTSTPVSSISPLPSGPIDPQSTQQIFPPHVSSPGPFPGYPVSSARFPVAVRPSHTPVHPVREYPGPRVTNPITSPSDSDENQIDTDKWSCARCTYYNHPDLQNCEMCDMPR